MPEAPAKRPEIQAVAVIGAGAAGRGIAQAVALGGYRTILEDLLPNALRRAQTEIRNNLDRSIAGGRVSRDHADAAFRCIEYAGSIEDAARLADLVIEAVPDELDSKLEIFTLLDRICRPHTILALTATSLTVTDIAPITFRRDKCVGMRFAGAPLDDGASLNDGAPLKPAFSLGGKQEENPRIEVIRGRDTGDATLALVVAFARRLTTEVVVTDESGSPLPAGV